MRATVVMAQLNLLVGDIDGNARRIVESAREARSEFNADLVVFPELSLTGYPPEDLLLRPSLSRRIDRALAQIAEAGIECPIVIGFPQAADEGLFNALTVIDQGRRIATYHKQQLPNYQVFDEQRYFRPGGSPCLVELFGAKVAFTICEDLWREYPVLQAGNAGADLLININASPFHVDKTEDRKSLLANRCRRGGFPIIYVNLVGGQDELVFDGASLAVDAEGNTRVLAPAFAEGLYPVEIEVDEREGACKLADGEMQPPATVEEQIYQALVLGVRDYVNKNGFPGVVLGLSGGIDSALTLAVAVDALGAERVQAVMMPFAYTSDLSKDAAAGQAGALGVKFSVIPIDGIYAEFIAALADEFAGAAADVSEQNVQARSRGVLLMAISNKKGLLVLTTGNKSELAVGYATLYGDMAGGFDVLKDVSKTMVYRLAEYRNRLAGEAGEVIPREVIERPPSAELAPGQVDADNLPPYDILDSILERYVERDWSANRIVEDGFEEEVVARVVRMVDRNEYKRRQGPPGVRLTQKAFGRDRRYPITNAWPPGD
ncbi:MAG: NAD+ synthase [Gammaproteobacteria bacterium]|nr:NAD+ synthase [Gammaproteobacteria bacterium]MYE28203.1 NAD+ synthase [Gammaproteobacteria bacterium]